MSKWKEGENSMVAQWLRCGLSLPWTWVLSLVRERFRKIPQAAQFTTNPPQKKNNQKERRQRHFGMILLLLRKFDRVLILKGYDGGGWLVGCLCLSDSLQVYAIHGCHHYLDLIHGVVESTREISHVFVLKANICPCVWQYFNVLILTRWRWFLKVL